MAEIRIAGVMRAGAFSPNRIGNDATIFNDVMEKLRKRGCTVNVYSEKQFQEQEITEPVIINMAREKKSIDKLQSLEKRGRLVINSGFGIANCTRERMTRLLLSAGVPYPESIIISTDQNALPELEKCGMESCWVKRGESHSLHREDVSYCRHPEEAQELLHEFFYRGIKRVVINRHLPGDLVKFYGVRGGKFFYWFYPYLSHNEKYGLDALNGEPEEIRFDVDALKVQCEKACEVLDVDVYGGDCIIDKDGSFSIIDFNDWPSFAPCRKDGAHAIFSFINEKIRSYLRK